LIAALVALVILTGLGAAVYIEHERADKATEQVEALTASLAASQAALDAYSKAQAVTQKRAVTNQKKVDNALASNPDWTSTRVPDDVWSSLFDNRPGAASGVAASGVPGAAAAR
jgi:type II secretory pathway pseudopilin PulG